MEINNIIKLSTELYTCIQVFVDKYSNNDNKIVTV